MLHANVFRRVQQICILAAFLCIPLLFSTETRDQFEIPKLIALSLWSIPLVIGRFFDSARRRPTTLEAVLFFWVFVQAVTSLPGLSIAWRTSLIGEYENFGGVSTSLAFAAWFYGLGKGFLLSDLKRVGFFAVTAGYLSALYAIAQSLGFDFVAWNPDTYNASRVFAGLGNPNFLSAYLAMSLPLHLSFAWGSGPAEPRRLTPTNLFALGVGLALLLASTGQGASRLGISSEDNNLLWIPGLLGLCLVSYALSHPFFRRGPLAAWVGTLLMGVGLVLTGSRGGWLGALAGLAVFVLLRRSSAPRLIEPKNPLNRWTWLRSTKVWAVTLLVVVLLIAGHPFFERLFQSTTHPMESSVTIAMTPCEITQ